jgi:phage tail sheath protein FI
MATYQAPGVYVEEVPLTPTITGVGTSTAGFIGVSTGAKMPDKPDGTKYTVAPVEEPQLVTSFDQFKRFFGDFDAGNQILAHSVYGFFNNGGSVCWVARVGDLTDAGAVSRVLDKFAAIDEIAIVAAPGALNVAVQTAIVDHCQNVNLQDRFAILDGQRTTTITDAAIKGGLQGTPAGTSDYAAIYFPWVEVFDPDPASNQNIFIPPSGLMAGIYARVDASRGVHKAPANEPVRGALGLEYQTTKAEQSNVNLQGINVIRSLNGSILVWGARTLGSPDSQKIAYINVRRLMNFLRESIDEGTQFAVFEPNSPPLWNKIIRSVTAFLTLVWRDGALFGVVPEQAFYVRCDESTNPPEVRDVGQVITEIGVAPVKPAEFVIFRIQQFSEIPAA